MVDPQPTVKPSRLRSIIDAFGKPSAATMFFFGYGSGLPFLLVAGNTLNIWLRDSGLSLSTIGFISYAGLFYSLKFLWAPLLDRFSAPIAGVLGRRRGWILISQLLVAVMIGLMGLVGPSAQSQAVFVALTGLAALAGATQDTVVDAYRIEIAPVEQQGALAATYTLGYRLALLSSGAGVLYLAQYWSWRGAYGLMAAAMLFPLGATLFAREPDVAVTRARTLAETFTGPFLEFFRRNGLALGLGLLAFVGLYKLPDQVLGVIAGPFYLDTGFTKAEIATVSKIFGVWIGIAGAFLGGVIVAAWGVKKPLIPAAIAVAVSNLLFITMAVFPGERWAFILTIAGDNLSQGFGGTVLVAFMSSLASASYTATQYALMSSLANLPGRLIGGLSGVIVEATSYTTFFVGSTFSVLPTLLVMAWLWGRLKAAPAPEKTAV